MDWKTLFFSAEGRIGRQSFWIGWLALLGVNVVLGWIPVIGWLISIVALYASVCVFAKRLHDMGRSGWLQVAPYVIGLVLVAVALASGGMAAMTAGTNADPAAWMGGVGVAMLCVLLAFLVWVVFTIWCGVTPSEPGPNKYGSPPAGQAAGTVL